MTRDKRSRWFWVSLLALLLAFSLTAGCGDDNKKTSGTADEVLKKQQAEQAAGDSVAAPEGTPLPMAEGEDPIAPPPAPTEYTAPSASAATSSDPGTVVRQALNLVRRGQYEQAINKAKAALRRNEKYVPAMVVMSRAYYHLGKMEFTESVCDIALEIDGNTGECFNLKGFVALKNKNEPLAMKHFEKATQVMPALGPAWLNLGVQYIKVKNYSAAVPVLERAASLMANRPTAHLNLGSAYRGAGQSDPATLAKAKASYDKALQLKSKYPIAYFNLGILFLDAPSYPGMNKLQQLNTAIAHFTKYKRQMTYINKNDPVDGFIKEAQKAYEREQKRIVREKKRSARNAAKKAKAAEKAAAQPAAQPAN